MSEVSADTGSQLENAREFAHTTCRIARNTGADAALEFSRIAAGIRRRSGHSASFSFVRYAPKAAVLLGNTDGFGIWLATIGELATSSPRVVGEVCIRTNTLLSQLNAREFRDWVIAGLRLGNAESQLSFFSGTDAVDLDRFIQDASAVCLETMERRLKAMSAGLWQVSHVLRAATLKKSMQTPRRTSFEGPLLRLPENFAGYSNADADALFKAAVAHVGAHNTYTREKFDVGGLKPIQVALVSLIEDARVELLAGRQYPGLVRLWRRFHIVDEKDGSAGPGLAETLMVRLSRALIDPAFKDDNPWIVKARRMFHEAGPDYDDSSTIRRIGVHLGNDLGQMRIQFNAKTHVVQPVYRDDNTGIWNFDPVPPEEAEKTDVVLESVRITTTEDIERKHERERTEFDPREKELSGRARPAEGSDGVPVATYPEWDGITGQLRPNWTTIVEYEPRQASPEIVERLLLKHAETGRRIDRLVRQVRVGRPVRLRRQPEGDRLDLDAAVRTAIDLRIGISPDPQVYETTSLLQRDLSILVLLDISESTKDTVRGGPVSVFSLERAATALLCEAMAGVGDPFALHAFCSNGRENVRYFRIKDFDLPYDTSARARLGGLRPGYSTRLGAALRHAGREISAQSTHRRLILVVTDGEPSDIDVDNNGHLADDARKAVQELGQGGIDTFCVALTGSGEEYLTRIFGRRKAIQIPDVESLPEKLPMLYFRLTA